MVTNGTATNGTTAQKPIPEEFKYDNQKALALISAHSDEVSVEIKPCNPTNVD